MLLVGALVPGQRNGEGRQRSSCQWEKSKKSLEYVTNVTERRPPDDATKFGRKSAWHVGECCSSVPPLRDLNYIGVDEHIVQAVQPQIVGYLKTRRTGNIPREKEWQWSGVTPNKFSVCIFPSFFFWLNCLMGSGRKRVWEKRKMP
jgi:hypothetical protein